jgi:hypothetical protein
MKKDKIDKPKRGGSRPGSGRKKEPDTVLFAVRIDKDTLVKARSIYGRQLHGMIKDFVKEKSNLYMDDPLKRVLFYSEFFPEIKNNLFKLAVPDDIKDKNKYCKEHSEPAARIIELLELLYKDFKETEFPDS